MKTLNRFVTLLVFSAFIGINVCHGQEVVNIQHIGYHDDRIDYFIPFDQPDVYYNDVAQTIIIDGDGAVDYYDVEICPASTYVPVITTQVNGYYDTIDISSLPQGLYCITIYSPEDNTFEGFFEIE